VVVMMMTMVVMMMKQTYLTIPLQSSSPSDLCSAASLRPLA
jgi:hypothetical protein